MNLHHVAIYGNNLHNMHFFYVHILGFKEVNRLYHESGEIRFVRLQVTETQEIELFNFGEVKKKKDIYVNKGYMHIGFEVDDISIIKDKLVKHNVLIKQDIIIGKDGFNHLFVEDPEKNLIEFTEKDYKRL